ncbi:unnamed protein product [marine sediment metagenome]|uniref:Tryptophan synthase beta chain-like PALP domain-containing protein n=1 Tax=marine sediment metagenome TaxID=412755 RepID=X0SX46_9ZZZZ
MAVNDRRVFDNIAEAVGNTPMVRLHRVVEGFPGEVYAKLEFLNPTGSVKDRIARYMVEKAAREGRLRPGGVIVESSSGNTALGLGMMAILGDYRCKVAVRDRASREKLDSLRALGIHVELVDSSLPPEHPDSYNRIMDRLVADTPDCYFPDQHNNRENSEAHYHTTGPEIWEQMEGRIDYFVAGIGTGGTICGVSRYLKEQDPRIQVIAVDAEGSIFYDYFHKGELTEPGPCLLEGLGDETLIECPEFDLIDDMLQVSDREAFLCTRQLSAREAIMAGGSSGAALWGVTQLITRLETPARIVTLFPDGATRYLTKVFDDDWMRRNGFME